MRLLVRFVERVDDTSLRLELLLLLLLEEWEKSSERIATEITNVRIFDLSDSIG